jgi:hypothetical protein
VVFWPQERLNNVSNGEDHKLLLKGVVFPGANPHERALKAGEFVLGYPDEISDASSMPQPEILGRNGSYVVFSQATPAGRRVPSVSERELAQR